MSFASTIGGMLGVNNDFSPVNAGIVNPTNQQQIQGAYDGSQNALAQQQSFLQALQGQNGIGNQSAVFGQMQGLAGTLQNQANGIGANPAMAQLQQTTAQNVSNQNALMAGQRNSGSNAGLVGRQAAMQGAATQQQAVGQGATMAANQQIAAQQQLMQHQANMGNMATGQVNQQANATTGLNQMNQNQQQMLQNAQGSFNNTLQGGTNQNNAINAGISNANQTTGNGFISGGLGAVGQALSGFHFAHGGMVPSAPVQKFAEGGVVGPSSQFAQFVNTQAMPMSGTPGMAEVPKFGGGLDKDAAKSGASGMDSFTKMFAKAPTAEVASDPTSMMVGSGINGGGGLAGGAMDAGALEELGPLLMVAYKGGQVPDGAPQAVKPANIARPDGGYGAIISKANGGPIAGKAAVPGDSLKNDTVPAMLSPGEVVIPRHVMQSKNPAEQAKKFVAAILAKQNKGA